jgi:uncharacterized membrane protein
MDRRGPSSLQQSSLQQSSLQQSSLQPSSLASRQLDVDIPGAVAQSLGILRNGGIEIVADQLRITGGIVFEVDANALGGINAILTVYAGIGDIRIVVSNTRIGGLDASRSRDWVDVLERGASEDLAAVDGRAFYLTREAGFVVLSVPIEMAPGLEIGIRLPYEEGVKIVQAIIDILVKHGR